MDIVSVFNGLDVVSKAGLGLITAAVATTIGTSIFKATKQELTGVANKSGNGCGSQPTLKR